MSEGVAFINKHPNLFKDFQLNLKKGNCVTCGIIPLVHCDPQFGMCERCRKEVTLTSHEFDALVYEVEKQRKIQQR
jgi:hypothetical protein